MAGISPGHVLDPTIGDGNPLASFLPALGRVQPGNVLDPTIGDGNWTSESSLAISLKVLDPTIGDGNGSEASRATANIAF